MRTSPTTVPGYHLRAMIETMQRDGLTEQEIARAVDEAAGRPARTTRRETRRWRSRLIRVGRRR